MWSEMTIKAGNQLYQKHSPHNPALHITDVMSSTTYHLKTKRHFYRDVI